MRYLLKFIIILLSLVILIGIIILFSNKWFLNFLNSNTGSFNVLFTFFVAMATIVYAVLTWRLVSETEKLRIAQTEPDVSVIIQPHENWINFIDMIIKNIGSGPAYGINFKVNPDFEFSKSNYLSKLNFIRDGIRYLAPQQKFQFFLTSMVEDFDKKIKTPFDIEITYKNKFGKQYKNTFRIDFSELSGLNQLGEPPLYKISKNIENIQKDIHHLSTGFHKLKTIVYTKKDIEQENKRLLKRIEQRRKKEAKQKIVKDSLK